jgi:hypothetical protein
MKEEKEPCPVFVGSPYRGDISTNLAYADAIEDDCYSKGEVPFLPHKSKLTIFYNDSDPIQRAKAIKSGLSVMDKFKYAVFYIDRGWSDGMLEEYTHAKNNGYEIQKRNLNGYTKEVATVKGQLLRLRSDICQAMEINEYDICSRSRIREHIEARTIFSYKAKMMHPNISDKKIGEIIHKDHATVRRERLETIFICEVWEKYINVSKIMNENISKS